MVNNKKTIIATVIFFLFSNTIILGSESTLLLKGESRFKNIRQLTFSGENAEAYFSLDGSQLVFQAHECETNTNSVSPIGNQQNRLGSNKTIGNQNKPI